jgi:hypothetical protein
VIDVRSSAITYSSWPNPATCSQLFMATKQRLVSASLSDVRNLWALEKTCTMTQNGHKVAKGALRDSAHRLYQGVSYCRNVVRFLRVLGSLMLFTPLSSEISAIRLAVVDILVP